MSDPVDPRWELHSQSRNAGHQLLELFPFSSMAFLLATLTHTANKKSSFIYTSQQKSDSLYNYIILPFPSSHTSHTFFFPLLLQLCPSRQGTHQGDPMASTHYALGLHTLLEEVTAAHTTLSVNHAFADDCDIGGTPEEVHRLFEYISTVGPAIGCHINRDKCVVIFMDGVDRPQLFPGVPRSLEPNFICLGSPIGTPEYCASVVGTTVKETTTILEAIEQFDNLHAAYSLFRYCATFPRLVFLMHTLPPEWITEQLKEFDKMIRDAFTTIFGVQARDNTWKEMVLSTLRGGLSLHTTYTHASAAYLASAHQSYPPGQPNPPRAYFGPCSSCLQSV